MDKGALGTSGVWRTQVDQAKVYSRTSRLRKNWICPGASNLSGFSVTLDFQMLMEPHHRSKFGFKNGSRARRLPQRAAFDIPESCEAVSVQHTARVDGAWLIGRR